MGVRWFKCLGYESLAVFIRTYFIFFMLFAVFLIERGIFDLSQRDSMLRRRKH